MKLWILPQPTQIDNLDSVMVDKAMKYIFAHRVIWIHKHHQHHRCRPTYAMPVHAQENGVPTTGLNRYETTCGGESS
jgi:hypothetical protein